MRLTLEVQEVPFSSSVGLSLSDNNSGHHLLSQLGLSLLDRSQEQVTDGSSRDSGQSSSSVSDRNNVQSLGSTVATSVQGSCDGQTRRNLVLDTTSSSGSSFAHDDDSLN